MTEKAVQKSPVKKVGRPLEAKSQYFDYQIGDGDKKGKQNKPPKKIKRNSKLLTM